MMTETLSIPADYQADKHLLDDKIVLVTGAGAGIGQAVAKACAAHGATVILLSKTVSHLEETYDQIIAAGSPQPAIYPMNLETAAFEEYEQLASVIQSEFSRLDGLLHNAAVMPGLSPLENSQTDKWLRTLHINLNAPYLLSKACLPLLKQSAAASIVFSSDRVAISAKAYWGAYGVSKAGLENLMQILADELEANTQIRVNSLDPGDVNTAMRRLIDPGVVPSSWADPDDVVAAYLYLLGTDSQTYTGKRFELASTGK